ncbi:C-4 methylsterol oxidase [Aureococcus anophagefferens]|nr:C-4 methylsterol oxidase [Aureococcus anophagefferens]
MLSRGWEVVRRRSCSTCAPRQTMSGKENFASPPAHGGAGRTPLQDAENITFRGSEVDLFSPSQDIFSPHITVRKRRRGRRAHQDAEAWASPVPADDDDDDEAPFVPPGLVVERRRRGTAGAEPAPESAPVLSPCGDAGPEVVALADAEDGDPSAGYDPRSPAKPAPNLTCVSLRKVERPAATTRPVSPEKLDFVAELVSPLLASPEAFRDGGLASPEPAAAPNRRNRGAARARAAVAGRADDLRGPHGRRAAARRGRVPPRDDARPGRRPPELVVQTPLGAAMVAALVVVAGGAPAARARAPRVATLVDAGGSAFFLADVALNFRTGYVSKGTLVLRSGRIAARYASTWLAPDLVTALGHSALVRDGAAALYGAWRGRGGTPEARRSGASADAKRADAAVVRTPAKELRASRTVTRRRGRFSVL